MVRSKINRLFLYPLLLTLAIALVGLAKSSLTVLNDSRLPVFVFAVFVCVFLAAKAFNCFTIISIEENTIFIYNRLTRKSRQFNFSDIQYRVEKPGFFKKYAWSGPLMTLYLIKDCKIIFVIDNQSCANYDAVNWTLSRIPVLRYPRVTILQKVIYFFGGNPAVKINIHDKI